MQVLTNGHGLQYTALYLYSHLCIYKHKLLDILIYAHMDFGYTTQKLQVAKISCIPILGSCRESLRTYVYTKYL